ADAATASAASAAPSATPNLMPRGEYFRNAFGRTSRTRSAGGGRAHVPPPRPRTRRGRVREAHAGEPRPPPALVVPPASAGGVPRTDRPRPRRRLRDAPPLPPRGREDRRLLQPEPDLPRAVHERLPRIRGRRGVCRAGLHERGDRARAAVRLRPARPSPARGEHPAGQRRVDRPG